MRLATEQRTFQTNIPAAPVGFQIQATAKAFQVLSSGLYTNKALAIVRELVANAIDAHKVAGTTDIPFRVHFPTQLEPWFEIEDFGTGLSDADVRNLYCTYFASNKTDSDDLIGGYGLGSKSPFAYTDQFTVVSRHGGVTRTYAVFISKEGTPSIMCTDEVKWDYQQFVRPGLTVNVGVAGKDRWDFVNMGSLVMPYITECAFETNIDVERPKYSMEVEIPGTEAKLKVRHASHGGDIHVIQGSVRYTTDIGHCPELSGWPSGIDIYVPIGTLDHAVNRENIAYSEKTRAWFREQGPKVKALMQQQLLAQLTGYTTIAARTQFLLSLTRGSMQSYVQDDMFDVIDPPPGLKLLIVDTVRGYRRRSRSKVEVRTLLPDANYPRAFTKFIVSEAANNCYWSEAERHVRPWAQELHAGANCPDRGVRGLAVIGDRAEAVKFIESLGMLESNIITIPKPARKPRQPGAPRVSYAGQYWYYKIGEDRRCRHALKDVVHNNPYPIRIGGGLHTDLFEQGVRSVLRAIKTFGFPLPTSILLDVPEKHSKVRASLIEAEGAKIEQINVGGSKQDAMRSMVAVLGLDLDELRILAVHVNTRRYTAEAVRQYSSYPYEHGMDLLKKLADGLPDLVGLMKDIREFVKAFDSTRRAYSELQNFAYAIFDKGEVEKIVKESEVNLFEQRIETLILTHGAWVKHLMNLSVEQDLGEHVAALVYQIAILQRKLNDKESECTPISLLNEV